jgi:membrane peptidoglycan carboxypeptidase
VFAQLILDVGAQVVADISEQMIGMDPTTEGLLAVPALATGSVAISPVDMAAGYQTIANDGRHCDPYTVQSIEREGEMLLEHERACDPVLKQGDARLITSMLEAVPVSGTAASAFGAWGSWPVAGKTGTAQENTNVWFGGYTKQFTTVVWVGSPGNPYSMGSVFGGTVAAPIWVSFMSRVMQGLPAIGFPDPPKPPEGPVPSVIGMRRTEAITVLSEAGFRASVEVVDDSSPKGQVFSQSPGGGSITALGTLIQIQISTGVPAKAMMPRVVDMRGYLAAEFLRSLGLVVELVRVQTGDPDKVGYVIAQEPRSRTEVVQGSTVRIFVGEKGNGGGNGNGNGGGNGGGG